MISLCRRVASSHSFQTVILAVIVINAVLIGFETSPALWERYGDLFDALNFAVQVIFAVEIAVRLLKQKAKRIYGLLERQFQHYFTMAMRQKGNTGENLLVLMERRLDNVVLNRGLALSRFDARQMVAPGHVRVNGNPVAIPSYLVRPGDEVQVAGSEKIKKRATDAVEMNKGQSLPTWLEAMPTELKGKVIQLPKREDVPHPINEQLIIELCSK